MICFLFYDFPILGVQIIVKTGIGFSFTCFCLYKGARSVSGPLPYHRYSQLPGIRGRVKPCSNTNGTRRPPLYISTQGFAQAINGQVRPSARLCNLQCLHFSIEASPPINILVPYYIQCSVPCLLSRPITSVYLYR